MTRADGEAEVRELVRTAAHHFDQGPRGVDAMFEAFRQLGEQIAEKRAAGRQAAKDARNARRRARYRADPPARKARAAVVFDDELEVEPGCRCAYVSCPPCSWCENGCGDVEADR